MTESTPSVLVVDDERAIRHFLRTTLTAHGYRVCEAATGREAIEAAAAQQPDLVILDLGLPDMDGLEVARKLREWTQTPILVLSVREDEASKVAALDLGADDYLTKPFGNAELMARIRVALRHAERPAGEPLFEVGDLRVDRARRLVTKSGSPVVLTPTEYELLKVLVQHAGRVLTHRQLLHLVWGEDHERETHLLQVNIANLRHKIEPQASRPRYIITEVGVGYRLREE
ncbi:MAG TPA: response regulator [Anaerolineae bacterium]|nr:response regulator [Anaerolineae bacterium]